MDGYGFSLRNIVARRAVFTHVIGQSWWSVSMYSVCVLLCRDSHTPMSSVVEFLAQTSTSICEVSGGQKQSITLSTGRWLIYYLKNSHPLTAVLVYAGCNIYIILSTLPGLNWNNSVLVTPCWAAEPHILVRNSYNTMVAFLHCLGYQITTTKPRSFLNLISSTWPCECVGLIESYISWEKKGEYIVNPHKLSYSGSHMGNKF